MSTAAVAPVPNFPPYGLMHKQHLQDMEEPRYPGEFRIGGKTPMPAQWETWLNALADELAAGIWPRYSGGTWAGAAHANMLALTQADLALMSHLALHLDQSVTGREPCATTHSELFVAEDEHGPIGSLRRYDPTAPDKLLEQVSGAVRAGGMAVGALSLHLKQRMQRPRPYQMAQVLGQIGFSYRNAKSACTPSLVSGHALQGAMASCYCSRLLKIELAASPGTAGYLQQCLIDSGDRRVFAGVHYSSDNLSSWFCALRLCENLLGAEAQEGKDLLWRGIQTRSLVYRAIAQAVANDPASPFAAPLAMLTAEALRPV